MKEGHGAIVIGSAISGGVRNVFVERCGIGSPHLMYAIRFKNNAIRGCLLENFFYRNIRVDQVIHAVIQCEFHNEEGANSPHKPVLRNASIERMTVGNASMVADPQGLPVSPIRAVTLRNYSFDGVAKPSIVCDINALSLRNVLVNEKMVNAL
ncbi:hypothetical protein [Sphingobium yanoikuyae]|uniref:hypothetical protein n=1 Tax=Sphingobium yanoikuyae TaxID=13690 RepID=UPI00242E17D8|nr:hypothetical protein [Sphingobium yanoikuyae]